MTDKLVKYLISLKGHDLNAMSGNKDGDLEMSIDLRKEIEHKDEDPSAHLIRNSKILIMLNKWQLLMGDEVKVDNTTSYPEVEYFLADTLKPEKIEDVLVDDDLKKIEFITPTYRVISDRSNGERILVHDFDFQTTLQLKDGDAEIVSKEKEFPFVD